MYWPNTTPGITSYNTFIVSYAFEAFAVRGRYEFKEMEYFLARGIGSEERFSICINGILFDFSRSWNHIVELVFCVPGKI